MINKNNTNGIDYGIIISAANRAIRDVTNDILIKEQQQVSKQPKYPFATHSLNNPYLNAKQYNVGADTMKESVEIVLSYTFYSNNSLEAANLAQTAMSNFNHYATRQELWRKGIGIVGTSNVGNRDTFMTIDIERRFGFDVRLRVSHEYVKKVSTIGTVVLDDYTDIKENEGNEV